MLAHLGAARALGRRRQRRRPPRLPAARLAGHARAGAGGRRAAAPRERPGGARRVTERLAHRLGELLAEGEPVVLVTVAEAKGSTPREAGAAMLVTAERSFGTIGGGRLEWEGIAHARVAAGRAAIARAASSCRWARPSASAAAATSGCACAAPAAAELAELEAAEAAAEAALPLVLLFGAGHVGRALAARPGAAALAPALDRRPRRRVPGHRLRRASRSWSPTGRWPRSRRHRRLPPPSSSPTATASTSPCAAPCSSAATSPISA